MNYYNNQSRIKQNNTTKYKKHYQSHETDHHLHTYKDHTIRSRRPIEVDQDIHTDVLETFHSQSATKPKTLKPIHSTTFIPPKVKPRPTIRNPFTGKSIDLQRMTVAFVVATVGTLSAFIPLNKQGNTFFSLFVPSSHTNSTQHNAVLPSSTTKKSSKSTNQSNQTDPKDPNDNSIAQTDESTTAQPTPTPTQPTPTPTPEPYHNIFTPGQCTDWVYDRFYKLHGYSIPWDGNAADWSTNAKLYNSDGWVVSSQPREHAIIVLQPGVQHAGPVGHVAIVEKINPDGTLYTSSYNVEGVGILTHQNYTPGEGVSFIWHT